MTQGSVRDALFGRFIRIDVDGYRRVLRTVRGVDKLMEVGSSLAKTLADGTWTQLSRHQLFALLCLSQDPSHPLLALKESTLWASMDRPGLIVQGRDHKTQKRFDSDNHVVGSLWNYLPALSMEEVNDSIDLVTVESWMTSQNLILVGGPKANRATEHCFELLWPNGAPFRFVLSGCLRKSSVFDLEEWQGIRLRGRGREGQSEVQTFKSTEDVTYGVLVACKNPKDSKGVTTVVIAGCTGKATERMLDDLRLSEFYNLYMDAEAVGGDGPQAFLFKWDRRDAAARGKGVQESTAWERIDLAPVPNRGGRPKRK